MWGKQVVRDVCIGCGVEIDQSTMFSLQQGAKQFCCRCYLDHDSKGEPLYEGHPQADVLHVMTSPQTDTQ